MNMIRFCTGRPRLRRINQTSEPRHNTPGISPDGCVKTNHTTSPSADHQSKHPAAPETYTSHFFRYLSWGGCVVSDMGERKQETDRTTACAPRPPPPPAPGKRTKHSPLTTTHHPALQNCSSDSPPPRNSIVAFTNSRNQQQKRK